MIKLHTTRTFKALRLRFGNIPGPALGFSSFGFIPNENFGADSFTSLSARSGLYAPGEGVTKDLGSFGLMCIVGALGSSLPVKECVKVSLKIEP